MEKKKKDVIFENITQCDLTMAKEKHTILVMLKMKKEIPISNAIFENGKILWSGRNGFDIIGPQSVDWDRVILISYSNTLAIKNAINKIQTSDYKSLQIFSVKPDSKLRAFNFL